MWLRIDFELWDHLDLTHLLTKLVSFARSSTDREEDPVTEILAYLVHRDPGFCRRFVRLVDEVGCGQQKLSVLGQPLISTQHTVPSVGNEGGFCRYDLLFRWMWSEKAQLVVEVKIRAGLTTKAYQGEGGVHHIDQLQRYLALAETSPSAFVVGLGIWPATVPRPVRTHPRFLGCVSWQDDHDRIGYRLFIDRDRSRFAFMGLWHGEGSLQESTPGLYFFLGVARGTRAQEALDEQGARISRALVGLNEAESCVHWEYEAGGYEAIQCRTSMLEVLRASDTAKAMEQFFKGCLNSLTRQGILDLYFQAISCGFGS